MYFVTKGIKSPKINVTFGWVLLSVGLLVSGTTRKVRKLITFRNLIAFRYPVAVTLRALR